MTIRLLIADDHSLIREGLRKVFEREPDLELVAEATDVAGVLAQLRHREVDVAVLDLNMPGRSGLEAMPSIHAIKPDLPVLILSMVPERQIATRVFRAGGAGFVSKASAAEEIVAAVRRVAAGNKYVSPAVAEFLAADVSGEATRLGHDALSDRELQVLRLIASGRSTRQIADTLSLSVNTVATYRRRIMEKLGLRSDVDIARYAMEHRLVD